MRIIIQPLVFILLVCVTIPCLATEKTPGTIIYPDKDKEEVIFELPLLLFGDLNYIKLQEKVKYTDSFGAKKLLRPEQVKEIVFTYKGERIRMISIPKSGDLMLGSIFSASTSIFLKLEEEGSLSLFKYEYKQSSPGSMSPGGGMTGGYSYNVDKHLLLKTGGTMKWPRDLSFRKDMIEYFSDCPELSAKIDKKEFKKDHLIEIVRFYNSYYK